MWFKVNFKLDDYDYPHKYKWFIPCWLSTNERFQTYPGRMWIFWLAQYFGAKFNCSFGLEYWRARQSFAVWITFLINICIKSFHSFQTIFNFIITVSKHGRCEVANTHNRLFTVLETQYACSSAVGGQYIFCIDFTDHRKAKVISSTIFKVFLEIRRHLEI